MFKSTLLKWVMVGMLLFGLSFAHGQEIPNPGKNKIILIGQVVNNINGAPMENQEIAILSDSTYEPSFPYFNKVITDKEGFYYDTIIPPHEKGALKIYTFDYLNNRHDTSVYFRFNWSEDNILFAHFKLPVEPMTPVYQANFYYHKNPGGQNTYEYQFYDISNSEDIISWEWNFGDSHFSSEQNPIHIYETAGVYRVTLNIKIAGSVFHKPIETSIVKIINVTTKDYFHMGGHIFADYFPIDKGEVYLYKLDDEVTPIDTAIFSGELGYYVFPQLIDGQYIVKADLHHTSEYYNMFLSTYYSNKLHWTEADTIFHKETNWEYNVSLVKNNKVMLGPGKVSGQINYGNGNKNPVGPACHVEIILYDMNDHPVDVCHSKIDGSFELNSLDLSMYKIYAEVTGKHTVPVQLELNETQTEITYVNITISENWVNGSVNSGISNNVFSNSIGQVYPNPASDQIYINIDPQIKNELVYSLIDQQGRSIKTGIISPDNFYGYLIDINTLKSGLYFIHIEGSTQQTTRRFIKR